MANVQIHELNDHSGSLGRDDYLPTDNGVNTTKIAFTDILGYVGSVVGTPLVAQTPEQMIDTEKIYVYVGTTTASLTNGHWYYYSNATWNDGGLYNAEAVVTDKTLSVSDAPADAKVVGDRLEVIDDDITDINTELDTKADADTVEADIEAINTALETKADTDGMYEDMSVGNLISTQFVENKEPYLFRRTGNGKNIDGSEKAFIDKIIGGTIAWNQLVANSGSVSVTVPSGHKYYSNIGGTKAIAISNGSAISATGGTDNIVDLTALFGSAEIADYVYSLEQTTSGSGIAWLKSHGFIDGSYRAFDSGSLQSVKTSEHKTVGKNLMHLTLAELKSVNTPFTWNDNVATLNGLTYTINTNAAGLVESIKVNGTASANTNFRFNNYFSLPKGNYVLSGGTNTHNNDFNITNMKTGDVWNGSTASTGSLSLTVNENDTIRQYLYIKSGYAVSDVMLYPMIRFSDISDATYEPYHINSYPLDSDLELRGKFKLDANNNLYADGDVYESSGAVSRKYGIVDLGMLNYTYDSANTRFYTDGLGASIKSVPSANVANIIANGYVTYSNNTAWNGSIDKSAFMNNGRVYFVNHAYTDATAFKTAMSGVYLVYELATPTTEQADPYASPQIVNPLGTEEYVDTRDVPVPVGHETKYMANLREKIEDLPWDLSMIAPIENGATASQAYEQGKYFLKDNQFCKALTSIASGATFTLNTNYAVTTVANELYTALHS